MFGRVFISQLKCSFRSKTYMFWCFAFPLMLGTLFYFAFHSIYDSQKSETIPVVINVTDNAVHEYQVLQAISNLDSDRMSKDLENYYTEKATAEAMGKEFDKENPVTDAELDSVESIKSYEDMAGYDMTDFPYDYLKIDRSSIDNITREDLPFIKMVNELEYDDGTKMMQDLQLNNTGRLSEAELKKAEEMLSDGDIAGIITVDSMQDVSLLVNGSGVKHSILSTIISEYKVQVGMAIDTINEKHENLENSETIMDKATEDIQFVDAKNMAGDNKDPFVAYFYNLIAMVAIMGSVSVMRTIVESQANQSTNNTGIRIDVSPVRKTFLELINLAAITFVQLIIITVMLFYLIFVLKIRFGGNLGYIFLTGYLASFVGNMLGFMIGHFGTIAVDKKEAILMVIMLGGGFMSGLMYGDMKMIVEQNFPWFNRINPSAVITDAFYALNVFGVGPRYMRSVRYMILTSIVMLIIGCVLSRRRSYKSL